MLTSRIQMSVDYRQTAPEAPCDCVPSRVAFRKHHVDRALRIAKELSVAQEKHEFVLKPIAIILQQVFKPVGPKLL